MAYLARLKSGNYTDSDIKAFYIEKRYDFGPFIREVGDFIAHPKRNKGGSFDAAIGIYSQVAFFQRYQGKDKKPLEPIGDCEWWLKPYLDRKVECYPPTVLKDKLKMSKSELKKKINSWFPCKERFPKRIEALNPFEFYDVVNFFCRLMGNNAAFQAGKVKNELKKALKENGIASINIDDFLIGTATILNGMKVELAEGVTANISIGVSKQRHTRVSGGAPELLASGGYLAITHPDGPLEISIQTETPKEHNLVDVGTILLDTEIDTERYFDRSLIHYPHPQLPQLNLKQDLQFVSSATPNVTAC
ncbi:hypothetical protein [Chachezhania sediminis]|uniref:hypothetical protein n=1 Tax=Chachezhania sediminis TaxID=2599291 RepID=UPI00131CA285|nr:hypothetical protein [Chachezhania sediminis]